MNDLSVTVRPEQTLNQLDEAHLFENGLIRVYKTDTEELIVDGRELWQGMGIKREFATWIKDRLTECDAVENEHYSSFDKIVKREKGATVLKEYIIKLDTAKEMAMLERNEAGKQYRKYFIQVEKRYKELLQDPYANLSPELRAIFTMDGKVQKVEQRIDNLENTMVIDYAQQRELQEIAAERVVMLLGGKTAPAYKPLSKRAFSECWGDYKRYMHVNAYANTAKMDFAKGRAYLADWIPSKELQAMIYAANSEFEFQSK